MSVTIQSIAAKLQRRSAQSGLTAREMQVLQLVCAGWQSKKIAPHLGIHQRTVENIRQGICEKLKAKTPAHMAYIACQRGWV